MLPAPRPRRPELKTIGVPAYRDGEDGCVQAAEYRVWVRAPDHVRPVDVVDYDHVVTERLERTPRSTGP